MRLVSTNESADGKKVTYRFELEDLFEHERCRRGTFLAHLIAHANGVTVTRFLGQILLADERRLLDKVELTPNTHPTEILLGDPCMIDSLFTFHNLNAWSMDFRYEGENWHIFYYFVEQQVPRIDISGLPSNKANLSNLIKDVCSSSYFYHDYDRKLVERLRTEFGVPNQRQAVENIQNFEEHEDIGEEFLNCLEYEDFEYPTGPDVVEVEGYTAKSIHEIAGDRLNPLGVYNYMIYLRENPEAAKAALDKRLVVR